LARKLGNIVGECDGVGEFSIMRRELCDQMMILWRAVQRLGHERQGAAWRQPAFQRARISVW
jgi:hypothetical protein